MRFAHVTKGSICLLEGSNGAAPKGVPYESDLGHAEVGTIAANQGGEVPITFPHE
jgi:hypothetical protein